MPTNCTSFSGYSLVVCETISSGIKRMWFSDFNKNTVWSANTLGQIATATTANPVWIECEIDEQLSHFDEDIVSGGELRSKSITQKIELVLLGQSQETTNAANQLLNMRGRIACELESGQVKIFGRTKALKCNGGGSKSGAKAGEETSFRLTFDGIVPEFAPTVSTGYQAANFA